MHTQKHGVAATKGHLASNGGLRGHSVGDVFPVIISQAGTFDNLKTYVQAPDGCTHLVNNYEEGLELAHAWLDMRAHTDNQPAARFVRDKVKDFNEGLPESEGTQCEAVGLSAKDFDFYSVYAYDNEGFAGAVWDSKGNDVHALLMSLVVIEFLEGRGVKL